MVSIALQIPEDKARIGSLTGDRETWWTWANGVTCVRTIACVICFVVAGYTADPLLNFVGLGLYWGLDVLDGYLARALDQETRVGAQLDILSDRLLVALFYFNYMTWHPELVGPVALFLFNFMFLDHFLSNQFMRWPLRSPNYFHIVDRLIFALNWSKAAKAINTGLVTLILVLTDWYALAYAVCLALVAVKSYSIARLHQLHPEPLTP
jgi:CDP-diacylglycerol--glycerol-3-phosphate 3-phosphatidyltransferase